MVCAHGDASACAVVDGLAARGVATLSDAILWLAGRRELEASSPTPPRRGREAAVADLGDIRGHQTPKLALQVAAAGGHNLLFSGPPGTGKSAMLRRLTDLRPPLTSTQRLAVLQVHAAAGLEVPADERSPLRAPHHSSSAQSVLGGGADVRPGEVTLAHHGVLFLDELPEFRRDVLEAMRQPLEDGTVTVGRAQRTVTMPARFLLAAARNPCPCGFLGDRMRPCRCTPAALARYQSRLSGPLLDRLDLQVTVPALTPAELRGEEDPGGTSRALREAVLIAHERQLARNPLLRGEFAPNRQLSARTLHAPAHVTNAALDTLDELLQRGHQSPRGRLRLLRVARTLADLDDRDRVESHDVLTAGLLRSG